MTADKESVQDDQDEPRVGVDGLTTGALPLIAAAEILDGAGYECSSSAGVLLLVDRLIGESPACDLWTLMTSRVEDRPSGLDLAELRTALRTEASIPEARETARWLLGNTKTGRGVLERLERMAIDAGEECFSLDWANHVVAAHLQVDRLIEIETWADPMAVLETSGETRYDANWFAWINIVRTRLNRGEGDAVRLREVLRRLEVARDEDIGEGAVREEAP